MSRNIDSHTHKLERNKSQIIYEYKCRSLIDYKIKRINRSRILTYDYKYRSLQRKKGPIIKYENKYKPHIN
jgi:hypothetical protein